MFDTHINSTNNGDNTIRMKDGFDCTNFVSQELKAGGIIMSGPGQGGTIFRVRQLAAALPSVSQVTPLPTIGSPLPANLAPGDFIEFLDLHMTMVISTSPVLLAYHSYDNCGAPLSAFPASAYPATVFHITGDRFTMGDHTPPTVVVNDANGNVINDLGFASGQSISVTVNAANGTQALEVTKGAPLVDRIQDFLDGTGTFIFQDQAAHGNSYTYTVDLSSLSDGDIVFAQAFDSNGNPGQPVRFTIARTPPTLAVQSGQGQLPIYAVTNDNSISGTATHNPAPVGEINVFQDGNPYNVPVAFAGSDATFGYQFDPRHWYWVQACDAAVNCSLAAFCIESPSDNYCQSSNVPPPPAAPQGGTP